MPVEIHAIPGARFMDPVVLARIGNLELVARTAVDGFLTGLHRSPHYGFSQEFKEYRAYVEGDDPRFVDWNVYARTERTYIRRYEGETNTRLMLLVDASASMAFPVETNGKWKLAGGMCEQTDDDADLRVDVQALGCVYLGGFTFAELRRAMRIDELREGAIERADAVFRTDRAPWCPEIF